MTFTKSMKQYEYVGYKYENDHYILYDFGSDDILDTMDEVAILYDGDVLLKHGHPDKVNTKAQLMRKSYAAIDINLAMELIVIQGKIPIDELDKALALSNYIVKQE
jgi:hypothetical protein